MKSISILLLTFLCLGIFSCTQKMDQLEKEGYQVFSEYSIAIKTPCEFVIDSTNQPDINLGQGISFVCPQIFRDSNRTSFFIQRLIESKNKIYHLVVWNSRDSTSIDSQLAVQSRVAKHFEFEDVNDINVDGRRGLIYGLIDRYTCEAYIPTDKFIYYIAVTGDEPRSELTQILANTKIGE